MKKNKQLFSVIALIISSLIASCGKDEGGADSNHNIYSDSPAEVIAHGASEEIANLSSFQSLMQKLDGMSFAAAPTQNNYYASGIKYLYYNIEDTINTSSSTSGGNSNQSNCKKILGMNFCSYNSSASSYSYSNLTPLFERRYGSNSFDGRVTIQHESGATTVEAIRDYIRGLATAGNVTTITKDGEKVYNIVQDKGGDQRLVFNIDFSLPAISNPRSKVLYNGANPVSGYFLSGYPQYYY